MTDVLMGIRDDQSLPARPLADADRLTVHSSIHQETLGENPVSCSGAYSVLSATREEPYSRRAKVSGEKWVPIDRGWVTGIGHIFIENKTGMGLPTIPSDEEKKAYANTILLLRLDPNSRPIKVRPGRHQILTDLDDAPIEISSPDGEARINYTIFPL